MGVFACTLVCKPWWRASWVDFLTIFWSLIRLQKWMQTAVIAAEGTDQQIAETIRGEQSRLRNFIRRRVRDVGDAEDILQDVFYELVVAYRLMKPVEEAGRGCFAWPVTGSPISCERSGRNRCRRAWKARRRRKRARRRYTSGPS